MGLPRGLVFRTKGQLAIGLLTESSADGVGLDFVCGDEVYGNCTELREFCEDHGQGYVLRVRSSFHLVLAGGGPAVTCAQAARALGKGSRRWEVRSAGTGSKGQRWYAWACLATASPRHYLLIRRHLTTGELAYHYCYVPDGQPVTATRLIRAARAALAGRRRFRIRQELLRARPVPGPPLHRDRPPHSLGNGSLSRLRRHRCLAP